MSYCPKFVGKKLVHKRLSNTRSPPPPPPPALSMSLILWPCRTNVHILTTQNGILNESVVKESLVFIFCNFVHLPNVDSSKFFGFGCNLPSSIFSCQALSIETPFWFALFPSPGAKWNGSSCDRAHPVPDRPHRGPLQQDVGHWGDGQSPEGPLRPPHPWQDHWKHWPANGRSLVTQWLS